MKIRPILFAVLLGALPACGAIDTNDALENDDAGEVDGKADKVSSTSTYYSVRQDVRKCAFPVCGGYFVKRTNFSTTTCNDGVKRAECYVVDFDVENGLGLSADEAASFRAEARAGQALMRGKIKTATYGTRSLGFFIPTEGYTAATSQAPTGVFYRISDSGIRCFTAPCPSLHQAKLNSTTSRNIDGVDFSGTGASDDQITSAWDEESQGDLLVAGTNRGSAITLVASQLYLRVRHVVDATGQSCGGFVGKTCPTGYTCDISVAGACNGADLPGTCKVTPQVCYDLYKPVCGCDGKTYGNDCNRLGAGAQLDHAGPCGP